MHPRNWIQELISLNKLPEATPAESIIKNDGLHRLAMDFQNTATHYGKIIIMESYLSPEQKTIKPISIGGIAGGEKFIIQGILFKFAFDSQLPGAGTRYMYGGDEGPKIDRAMKAAAAEL